MAVRLVLESELAEVGDDDICPVRPEIGGVIAASHAHHEPEPAGTSRFHTDEGISGVGESGLTSGGCRASSTRSSSSRAS